MLALALLAGCGNQGPGATPGPGSLAPVSITEPLVRADSILRPHFHTVIGNTTAGTAFFAQIGPNPRDVAILTALHLLGPAGGLRSQLRSDALPNAVQAVRFETIEGETAAMMKAAIGLHGAHLMSVGGSSPPGGIGDIAMFLPTDDWTGTAWKLAQIDPAIGEPVWLASPQGSGPGLAHRAIVEEAGSDGIWYTFDRPVRIAGTSGAAVLNAAGQVCAVTTGGGGGSGRTRGWANPVSRWRAAVVAGWKAATGN